jgi:UDP-3-O-[3-hydroxymyristoyl] glucosamine N-acyltransferase|tara:strand:+ start:28 stop:840 length:813 start_codon:yes stop_codon:yes gene_type:complete
MLSILKNASPNSTTYYVGDNLTHLKHLKDCTLYCKQLFNLPISVKQIIVEDPQLEFYKLSHKVNFPYTFNNLYTKGNNCNIHPTSVIGDGVTLGDNVTIGPNSVIYSKTQIGDNVRIDSNVTIGTEGMMWVWDNNKKIYLRQLGGVIIEDNTILCSGCVIVRGSANEVTYISEGSNLAPNCAIGHGTYIGKYVHLANNVSTGGSSYISDYNFLGSGVIISAGVKLLTNDIILGAGAVVTKNITTSGVFVGLPAKFLKSSKGKLSGMPLWR